MCHGHESRPPIDPGAGGGSGSRIVLEALDGNRFAAFAARADAANAPGVVILPDVRGLHSFYEELTLRFCESAVHAVAIDYYGRTAGVGSRGDVFDHEAHFEQATDENVGRDVTAGVAHIRSPQGGGATAVFTVGFCFGGRISFNQAASGQSLAGVVGFYGRVSEEEPGDPSAPVVQAAGYACPVLGLFGRADPNIVPADIEAFRGALDAAGVPNELVTYESAPHSFFDRRFAAHERACRDAWARVLGFIEAHRWGPVLAEQG
jgi:carboxymethylenebutenolidase